MSASCHYLSHANVLVRKLKTMNAYAVVKFPTIVSCHWLGINSNTRFSPTKRKCNLHPEKLVIQGHSNKKNIVLNKTWDRNRVATMASKRDPQSGQNSFSPAHIVGQFYKFINEKELQQLRECISKDACFDDYAFTKLFEGKKEIMGFLTELTDSMGRDVKFRVERIYEGDDLVAAARWHLEWKEKQIPFTRGCTFFELSEEGENMTILRADVLIESPIKPGSIVLTLLKNVTSIFDDFPRATDWFLRSPHLILTWISRIQSLFIAPLVSPLLGSYIKLWSFFVRLLSHALSFLICISKFFIK